FFLLLRCLPRSTLFPYTTLFRSFFDGIYNLHLKVQLLLPSKTADCNLDAYVVLFFFDADLLNTFCLCDRYIQYWIIYISNDFFNLISGDHSKILLYAYG